MRCVPANLGPRPRRFLLRLLLVAGVADGLKVVHRVHPARLEVSDVVHLSGTNLAVIPGDLALSHVPSQHARSIAHKLWVFRVRAARLVKSHQNGTSHESRASRSTNVSSSGSSNSGGSGGPTGLQHANSQGPTQKPPPESQLLLDDEPESDDELLYEDDDEDEYDEEESDDGEQCELLDDDGE